MAAFLASVGRDELEHDPILLSGERSGDAVAAFDPLERKDHRQHRAVRAGQAGMAMKASAHVPAQQFGRIAPKKRDPSLIYPVVRGWYGPSSLRPESMATSIV